MTVAVDGFAVVGEVLGGKYRVDKILGVGGMGMVVAATHLEIDQRVALKFMLPSAHESPEMAARFLREARAAGRLNSEHVCRVMDVGRFETGAPYIVMEYLHGENLAARLRRHGPMRVSEAVDVVLQAIEGLAEAHAHGIVHRDLKPDNLFLARRNDGAVTVKVLDFGISKVAVTGIATGTGDIMGSPAYMAPEQMQASRDVDQRADVWSLGVVLYQIVVGKLPFHGDSLPLLCMHVVNDAPMPMSAIRGDLPDGFEAVVMKCLSKEPPDRYGDVGQLAAALAGFGPKHATTSVSRIQVVLARARDDGAATISHEFSTIAPTLDHDPAALGPPPLPALPRGAVPPAEPSASPPPIASLRSSTQRPTVGMPQETTLGRTSGQVLGARGEVGRPWGLIGAISAAVGLVALVLVFVWRGGQVDDAANDGRAGLARPRAPLAAPGAASGAPGPGTAAGAQAPGTAAATQALGATAGTQAPGMTVEPIEGEPTHAASEPAPATAGSAVSDAAPDARAAGDAIAPPEAQPAVERGDTRSTAKPARKKRPRRGAAQDGAGSDGAAPEAAAGSGAGSATPPDDDVWTHMTHDGSAR